MDCECNLAYWFDVTADLLQRPLTEFPCAELAAHLNESFELTALSWEWRENRDDYGFAHFAGDGSRFTPSTLAAFHARAVMDRHPLLRWFAASGDATAQSVGRIPNAIVNARDRDWFNDHLVPFAVEQQLSIPYWMQGVSYGAFVLTRTCEDFGPDELDLARHLQRLIAGLYVQVRAQRQGEGLVSSGAATQVGLTGTEVAVLSLLTQGHTAQGIARQLSNSPRTVHKHLEHIYRKLGVSDRLRAVQVAAAMEFDGAASEMTHHPGGR